MSEGSLAFNPDFDPDGAEGGVDTNLLPWLPLADVAGFSLKPLRASMAVSYTHLTLPTKA